MVPRANGFEPNVVSWHRKRELCMANISEIKLQFEKTEKGKWNTLFSLYQEDQRMGVKKLIQQYRRKLEKYENEMLRLDRMLEFERKYGDTYTCICGIDEAGRGPCLLYTSPSPRDRG